MKNIESRLSKVERDAAKSTRVEVVFIGQDQTEDKINRLPLLEAIQKLLTGEVLTISRPFKSQSEEYEHHRATAEAVADWFREAREKEKLCEVCENDHCGKKINCNFYKLSCE